MSLTERPSRLWPPAPFQHEALLYNGDEEFTTEITSFLRQGIAAGEPALVVVSARKIAMLRDALGGEAKAVAFADMAEVGSNPACIIPVWRDFLDRNPAGGGPTWGVGEPIYLERSADELVECQLHEALLNVAFADAAGFTLLCPYDVEQLDAGVLAEAHASHTSIGQNGATRPSETFRQDHLVGAPYVAALREPPRHYQERAFDENGLPAMRAFVSRAASEAGLLGTGLDEFVFAANELATNSVRYGGGGGVLRIWHEPGAMICELSDNGQLREPLVGRTRPDIAQVGGRGLWLANQLCDLMQMRSHENGTTIRLLKRF